MPSCTMGAPFMSSPSRPLSNDEPMASSSEQVAEVEAMFAEKGFALVVEQRDGSDIVPRSSLTSGHGFWVDLVNPKTNEVLLRNYGSGPSRLLAIIATEQRWLVEEEGSGFTPGDTYVTKAEERLRRRGLPPEGDLQGTT
jgi:hypothetical protein